MGVASLGNVFGLNTSGRRGAIKVFPSLETPTAIVFAGAHFVTHLMSNCFFRVLCNALPIMMHDVFGPLVPHGAYLLGVIVYCLITLENEAHTSAAAVDQVLAPWKSKHIPQPYQSSDDNIWLGWLLPIIGSITSDIRSGYPHQFREFSFQNPEGWTNMATISTPAADLWTPLRSE